MDNKYLHELTELGYVDEAGVAAEVAWSGSDGKTSALCVNGEVVSLVCGEPPRKIFKDSIDRLKNLSVKGGLFGKTLLFEYNGTAYALAVKKKNKNLIEYFELLASE